MSDPLVLSGVSLAHSDRVDELTVGVVGCGVHSTTAILPALRHAGLRLIAVCDLDLERAERAMRQFGGQIAYPNLDDLVAREDVDAVIVVGPPELHVKAGVAALEAGHHVFVEKPPGTSLDAAVRLGDAARASGKQVMVGFMKRYATAYRLTAQVIAEPDFGRVTAVEMTYAHWPVAALRTHLVDMSIHALDVVRWLLGEPVRISTYKRSLGDGHVVSLTIEHADAVSHLDLSAFQPGVQERLVVTGEGSVVTVENLLRLTYVRQVDGLPPENPNSRVTRSWSPELSLPDSENDMQVLLGYAGELRAFGAAIREGRDVSPSIDDGAAAMRLIEAIVAAPEGLSVTTVETS